MIKFFALFLLPLCIPLLAYVDSDMDGVDDAVDRCPNSLLTDIVDTTGCTVESLISPHHYDILLGIDYTNSDYKTLSKTDTLSSTFQADYYYKDFALQLNTSYFYTKTDTTTQTGFYDTYLGISYNFQPQEQITLHLGGGIIFPTYTTLLNNNKTDYFSTLNISYTIQDFNLFGSYSYTFIGDNNIQENNLTISYQNTHALSVGCGYYVNTNLYISTTYSASDSIYTNIETMQTLSFYGFYTLNKHYFTTLTYAYGLSSSASDTYASIKIGYFF